MDSKGDKFLHKERCVIRVDQQKAYVDYSPEELYAPVATHEVIRTLLAFVSGTNSIIAGAYISNAYLYGNLDIPIHMQQPTDSSTQQDFPGMICKLRKSIYGLKQAGEIWGSLLAITLTSWGSKTSNIDERVYMLRTGKEFMIIVVVVDDMQLISNSPQLMETLKKKLSSKFDIKIFETLKTFIGWEKSSKQEGIMATQRDMITFYWRSVVFQLATQHGSLYQPTQTLG